MDDAAAIRCAQNLIAGVAQELPAIKEQIARKEYDEAFGRLFIQRCDYHYDAGGNSGLKSLYRGPAFSVDFRLLMQALQEKNERNIKSLTRSLETILKQREMRRQALGENFDFED